VGHELAEVCQRSYSQLGTGTWQVGAMINRQAEYPNDTGLPARARCVTTPRV